MNPDLREITLEVVRDFGRLCEISGDYVSLDVSLTHGANTRNYSISGLHQNKADCAVTKQIVL